MKPAIVSGLVGAVAYRAMRQAHTKVGQREPLERTNFRGRPVSLSGGVVTAGALTLANLGASIAVKDPQLKYSLRVAAATTASAGFFGYIDDMDQGHHDGNAPAKGFRGHVGALKDGHLTTGMIKILGIGSTGLIAATAVAKKDRSLSIPQRMIRSITSGAVIAGSANMGNLVDLRPGRLQKVDIIASTALAATKHPLTQIKAGITCGVALAGIGSDLDERTMNGDTGANALGAAIGSALTHLSLGSQAIALAVIVGLTGASEKVSFTKVINDTPALKFIDDIGRRA